MAGHLTAEDITKIVAGIEKNLLPHLEQQVKYMVRQEIYSILQNDIKSELHRQIREAASHHIAVYVEVKERDSNR